MDIISFSVLNLFVLALLIAAMWKSAPILAFLAAMLGFVTGSALLAAGPTGIVINGAASADSAVLIWIPIMLTVGSALYGLIRYDKG